MRSTLLLFLLSGCLVVAGCSGGEPAAGQASEGTDSSSPPAGPVGVVRGSVVSEELSPIQGADLVVNGTGKGAKTAADGTFQIAGVPAGTQTLFVSVLGYESQAKKVQVVDGEAAQVEFQLAPVAVVVPYPDTIPFSGRFECSYAAANLFWQGCGYPVHDTVFPGDTTAAYYDKGHGAVQILHELRWESTSLATGTDLDFNVISNERTECQWYANAFGSSPLRLLVTVGQVFENPDSEYPVGTCGDTVVDELDTRLGVLVLSSPTYVQGEPTVGLTLQQPFDGFVTVFYHMDAPAGFTALDV